MKRAGFVEYKRLDQRPHSTPADRPRADRTDFDDDGCLLSRHERGDRARFTPVTWQVLKQRPNSCEAEVLCALFSLAAAKLWPLGESLLRRPAQRSAD